MPSGVPTENPTAATLTSLKVKEVKDAEDGVEYCLEASSSNTNIIVEECDDSNTSQSWIFLNNYLIQSSASEVCVTVDTVASKVSVSLQDCDGNNDLQKWEMETQSNGFETLKLLNRNEYCIDHNDLGSNVVIWQCDGSDDQYFSKIVRDI
jgi:hypothetical protein